MGYSPQGHKESDTSERLHFHFQLIYKIYSFVPEVITTNALLNKCSGMLYVMFLLTSTIFKLSF